MKRFPASLVALLLLAAPLPALALEHPPVLIDYQGRVLDSNNQPLSPGVATNYTMQFRIYSTATGGTALWGEQQTVTVLDGQFSVRIGEGAPITSTPDLSTGPEALAGLFGQKERYLGLTVIVSGQTAGEISPRLQFLTTPYALTAGRAVYAGNAAVAGSIDQSAGNSTLGPTTVNGSLAVSGASNRITLSGANVLEFGRGIPDKNSEAGTIGYGTYTPGVLDIVGAGTTGANRQIKIWAEGGTTFTGPVNIAGTRVLELGHGLAKGIHNGTIGYQAYSNALDIVGAGTSDLNRLIKMWASSTEFTGNLSFGSRTGQLVNLYGTNYAIGVQANTLYQRSAARFNWFVGGSHNDNENNPGGAGSRIMSVSQSGAEIFGNRIGAASANGAVTIGMDGNGNPSIEMRHTQNPVATGQNIIMGYIDFADGRGADYDVRLLAGRRNNNTVYVGFDRGGGNSSIDFYVHGHVVTTQSSCDLTLKDNIAPLERPLATVLALAPVDFEWRRGEFPERELPAGRHVGFIAQQVRPLVPEAVGEDRHGKLSMDFSKLVPYLVGAVQEQQARIERLSAENAALDARLSRLEAALARLDVVAP